MKLRSITAIVEDPADLIQISIPKRGVMLIVKADGDITVRTKREERTYSMEHSRHGGYVLKEGELP